MHTYVYIRMQPLFRDADSRDGIIGETNLLSESPPSIIMLRKLALS